MKYSVKFYKGDYNTRQALANKDNAILYVEHHFNGGSRTGNYTLANVATNASKISKWFASAYAERVSVAFRTPLANNDFAFNGVSIGGYRHRGNGNLYLTAMPAVLLEPLFASNPKHAQVIRTVDGQQKLAQCLVDTIKDFFPKGGLIAFSVGHKYKKSEPNDRGVILAGGGTEADYAEQVLLKAQQILESE